MLGRGKPMQDAPALPGALAPGMAPGAPLRSRLVEDGVLDDPPKRRGKASGALDSTDARGRWDEPQEDAAPPPLQNFRSSRDDDWNASKGGGGARPPPPPP
ncbi:hypothetical protein H632_c4629p0, partial [Helicosporidium sp. ATCC 50920]